MTQIALAMTIRNEFGLLRPNVLYHHFSGVDRFYVYTDRSTDGSADTVRNLPYVRIRETVDADKFRGRPEAAHFIEKRDILVTARICLNTLDAMDEARRDGMDWLFLIDADELVCLDPVMVQPGGLRSFLSNIRPRYPAVLFRPFEACQSRFEYNHAFEETLFYIPDRLFLRTFPDPIRNRKVKVWGVLGHRQGKMAIRLSMDAVPWNSHAFRHRDGRKLMAFETPYLLHYYMQGFSGFIRKFGNFADRPDCFLRGGCIPGHKALWRDIVNSPDFSPEYLEDYFRRYILFSKSGLQARTGGRKLFGFLPITRPSMAEITSVRDVFAMIKEDRLALEEPTVPG